MAELGLRPLWRLAVSALQARPLQSVWRVLVSLWQFMVHSGDLDLHLKLILVAVHSRGRKGDGFAVGRVVTFGLGFDVAIDKSAVLHSFLCSVHFSWNLSSA